MLSAEALAKLRLRNNITQVELGKEIGCSKNYISMIENRKSHYTEEWEKKCVNAIYTILQRRIDKEREENDLE